MTNQQSTPSIDTKISKFIHAPRVSTRYTNMWKKLLPEFKVNLKPNQMTGNLLDETLTTVIGTWTMVNAPWENELMGKKYNAVKLTYKLHSEDTVKTYGEETPPPVRSWTNWK
jgi:hypothetical protein